MPSKWNRTGSFSAHATQAGTNRATEHKERGLESEPVTGAAAPQGGSNTRLVDGRGGERSPARTPCAPASRKPFFLIMKLEPMNIDELIANVRPLTWSDSIQCAIELAHPHQRQYHNFRHANSQSGLGDLPGTT